MTDQEQLGFRALADPTRRGILQDIAARIRGGADPEAGRIHRREGNGRRHPDVAVYGKTSIRDAGIR